MMQCPLCLQSTSAPPARPHSTPTAQRDEPSERSATDLCANSNRKKNSLHHHGSRSHDDVDTDTESKCDTRCASLENQVLCLAVIPKAEGHKNCQKYTFFLQQKTSLHFRHVALPCAKNLRILRESVAFRRTRGDHAQLQKAPSTVTEVLKFKN